MFKKYTILINGRPFFSPCSQKHQLCMAGVACDPFQNSIRWISSLWEYIFIGIRIKKTELKWYFSCTIWLIAMTIVLTKHGSFAPYNISQIHCIVAMVMVSWAPITNSSEFLCLLNYTGAESWNKMHKEFETCTRFAKFEWQRITLGGEGGGVRGPSASP